MSGSAKSVKQHTFSLHVSVKFKLSHTILLILLSELGPVGSFSSKGARTGAIKLAMAGTQDWWCRFPLLLGC